MPTFEIDANPPHGVAIIANKERLTSACLSSTEIDAWVRALKADLDSAADDAKAALWGMKDLPDFPVGPH